MMLKNINFLSESQILLPFLGQKMVLTSAVSDGVFLYPHGAVGVLDAFQYKGEGKEVAIIIFDDDPTHDCVEVNVGDFMPVEFIKEGFVLEPVKIRRCN